MSEPFKRCLNTGGLILVVAVLLMSLLPLVLLMVLVQQEHQPSMI